MLSLFFLVFFKLYLQGLDFMVEGAFLADLVTVIDTQDLVLLKLIDNYIYYF